jgi:hypothetical protein
MEERQTNYTTMEGHFLPSNGEIYDKIVNKNVELRSMTARDEMKRLSPSVTPLKTLADIIEGCMIEKPAIKVYDMCLGDYEYLLHRLRVVTYGPKYAVSLGCPHCNELFDAEVSLDDLEVREFDINEFEKLRSVHLPKSDVKVELYFQTPRILDEIDLEAKEMKRKYKTAAIDFSPLIKLTKSIKAVDGRKLSAIELETFINNLPALDYQKLLKAIDDLNAFIGINNRFELSCNHCGGEVVSFFRLGSEFFRPSNI